MGPGWHCQATPTPLGAPGVQPQSSPELSPPQYRTQSIHSHPTSTPRSHRHPTGALHGVNPAWDRPLQPVMAACSRLTPASSGHLGGPVPSCPVPVCQGLPAAGSGFEPGLWGAPSVMQLTPLPGLGHFLLDPGSCWQLWWGQGWVPSWGPSQCWDPWAPSPHQASTDEAGTRHGSSLDIAPGHCWAEEEAVAGHHAGS